MATEGRKNRAESVKAIFANEEQPPAKPAEEPKLVTTSEPEVKPAAEIKQEEVKVLPASEIEDEDFNQRPAKPIEAKSTEQEPPVKPEDREERSIATLREQLGIQGRRAKELEVAVTERELDLRAKEEEISRLKAELEKPSRAVRNPMEVKGIKDIADEIVRVRDTYADGLKGKVGSEFSQNFESMLREHANMVNAESPEMRRQLGDVLRDRIGETIGDDKVETIMQILASNSGKYVDMRRMIDNIGDLAVEEEINGKVSSWDEFKNKASSSIASIADVDDEFIAANPNSPQSFVAKMVKDDPAYKIRADKVKAAVIEAFNGKRPLTREELTRLKENEEVSGVRVADFMKERGKREEANRIEMMKRAYLATMLLPELPDILADSAKARQNESAKEKERAALISGTSDRTAPVAGKEEHVRASDRPSAVGNVLAAMRQ
jgi:hypothetical protein